MIELAFVVCLSADPATCETRALQFSDVSLTNCTMAAQPQLAQWVMEHPGWRVQRWTCQPVGTSREI
ncbi:hypothetical protein [Rubellimicrobium aerolatum]|uniref:Uncharacterized protein n=1 Tax=Rubellimicrobium aerolatum TaxID=490979 RepID=A0ABW0SGW0_9RHOB|nr:hypothetical protein [Rubellimicrobium aerolatum]MBP1807427.1 hypothetical protein [Rubellimicrobium aerolatum]